MDRQIVFNYFYGKEADMLSFYCIPKLLFTDDYFRELSTDAKVLYGLLLDRMSISVKNEWFDELGRAYIYFSIEEIMELLNCGKNKAVKSLQELDADGGIGLIEKDRQGQGKATRIYVKSFVIQEAQKFTNEDSDEKEAVSEVYISNFKKFKNGDSRSPECKPLEVYFSGPNYNNLSNTDIIYTESNPIVSIPDVMRREADQVNAYAELIRENLAIDILVQREPMDRELIEGIYDLVLETVVSTSPEIVIAAYCNTGSWDLVKQGLIFLAIESVVLGVPQLFASGVRSLHERLQVFLWAW